MSGKFTITQFNLKYPNENACLEEIFNKKYSNLETCPNPKCGRGFKYYKVSERKCYACQYCSHQIHPLAGTIFHKSDTDLKLWFYAIFLFSSSKNGVSAKELERQLGVTYKTAWRMCNQIRKLFSDTPSKLSGTVEMDEAYLGGKEDNKHESKKIGNKGTQGKTAVLGAVERGGEVVARVVDDTTISSVVPFIRGKIAIGTTLNTDDYNSYSDVKYLGYNHKTVNHSSKEYVNGDNHTNTIEGFWSQLKRSIDGTYHMVSPRHLQAYVNEFAWRYNRRGFKSLFLEVLKEV